MDEIKQPFNSAVIPAAGLGTRLLSATKEQPKEMLPLFAKTEEGTLCLKPMIQMIFEQLFDFSIREFYFVVGREKRALEDHFTPEHGFVADLNARGKNTQAMHLGKFYERINESTIVWVNQPEPRGFGDAVLQVQRLMGDGPFLVHAGDTLIVSTHGPSVARRLSDAHTRFQADVTFAIQEVEDPRQHGVAEVVERANRILDVRRVVEKPDRPSGNMAIMPVYIFNPKIFQALRSTVPGKGGELQLTDAIQGLIDTKHNVKAIKLKQSDIRLDIGTPENYWQAIELSYRHASAKQSPHDASGLFT
jgi:UTP--glucose-1-phosphate uridylyltransferase